MKNTRKNVRSPVLDEDAGKIENRKAVRPQIGLAMEMDLTMYNKQYPNMTLFWCNDKGGELQRWLNAGAEPVPAQVTGRKVYKGLNDKLESEYVRVVDKGSSGSPDYIYALMMDPEDYDHYKIKPQEQKNANIKQAMKGGKADTTASLESGAAVKTYAASLPTGTGTGYNEIR